MKKTRLPLLEEEFIPCTMEREIAKDIVFRPIKSWHSLTYAGEGLEYIPGTNDRSGCLDDDGRPRMKPYSVAHRIYWHKKAPGLNISAVLSYPKGLTFLSEYFWEILVDNGRSEHVERFFGDNAEKKMEKRIVKLLEKWYKKKYIN